MLACQLGFSSRAAFAVALALFAACQQRPEVRRLPERAVFIAMERDFAEFRSWGALPLAATEAQGTTHAPGQQQIFINALPPAGERRYPVGTMIVKEVRAKEEQERRLFAMVKRGGNFNQRGAKDWEWFELKERSDGPPGIAWRGVGAPKGEEYGGDPLGTCNNCHGMAETSDFVRSKELALARNERALVPQALMKP